MNLPDLKAYRSRFQERGVLYPLKPVTAFREGLLSQLPVVDDKKGWPWNAQTEPAAYDPSSEWPKLTIVTPSFNQAQYLEITIRSVLLQNYPNLEYIIIDGGSTDGSVEIIKKYAPWLSYWQSEPDRGQSHAINMGFSLASGDYRAWINSDDYYLKDVFSLVISAFKKTNSQFIYGYGYNKDTITGNLELIKVAPFPDYFIKIPTLAQPSCFWSADIHQPVWEEMHCAMDYELWLRLVKGSKRLRVRQPLSVAHTHSNAKTLDPKMKEKWQEDHEKMWSAEAHGPVPEWKMISFLNRIRMKLLNWLNMI